MALEKFNNLAQTTLSAAINNSTTSIAVTDASSFSSTGNFRIRVDNEIMLVTSVSGNTFTATRGAESTTGVSHNAGAVVTNILTAGSLNQFRLDNIAQGAYASLPAAGQGGRIYQTTDGLHQFQDNGTSWVAYGPMQLMGAMNSTDYTWANQNGATSDFTGGSVLMTTTTSASNHNILYKAVTAPFTVTVNFIPFGSDSASFNSFNLWFWDSVNSKGSNIQSSMLVTGASPGIWVEKWNSTSVFSAEYSSTTFSTISGYNPANWLRLIDDGTSRTAQYSFDGLFWITQHSIARTDFLTPNSVGIGIRKDAANSTRKAVRVVSWYQT